MGIIHKVSIHTLETVLQRSSDKTSIMNVLIKANRLQPIRANIELVEEVINNILDGNIVIHSTSKQDDPIKKFAQYLNTWTYFRLPISDTERNIPFFEYVNMRQGYSFNSLDNAESNVNLLESDSNNSNNNVIHNIIEYNNVMTEEAKKSVLEWKSNLTPWNLIIEKGRKLFGERWVFFVLANIAASVKVEFPLTEVDSNFFDINVPLINRVLYAKIKSNAPTWWESQLDKAITLEQKEFILIICLSRASTKTILSIISKIDYLISNLPTTSYENLIISLTNYSYHIYAGYSFKYIGKTILNDANLNPKTLLALSSRLSDSDKKRFYKDFWINYRGDDELIIDYCQDLIIEELVTKLTQQTDLPIEEVEKDIEFVKMAYNKGVLSSKAYIYDSSRTRNKIILPLEIAVKIASEPTKYPRFLVLIAESICRADIAKNIIPIKTVAERDKWFEYY